MARRKSINVPVTGLMFAFLVWGQSGTEQNAAPDRDQEQKHEPGAAREIGAGTATLGTSTAKGAGDVAKGTAKGVGDVVTLHPIDAGVSVGKGAAKAGKDVTVGASKGTGKIARGVGRVFKKLF